MRLLNETGNVGQGPGARRGHCPSCCSEPLLLQNLQENSMKLTKFLKSCESSYGWTDAGNQ